jgi:hypothetical protein
MVLNKMDKNSLKIVETFLVNKKVKTGLDKALDKGLDPFLDQGQTLDQDLDQALEVEGHHLEEG